MAWVRIHDGAMQNLKITVLSDSAFRLWVQGLCYCQTALTDGLIPKEALRQMGAKRKDVEALSTSRVNGQAPLWEQHPVGFKVHDYLIWNDCREKVIERQGKAKVRKMFYTDHELRNQLRARDGDSCRYCGKTVHWTDRRGPDGATYDHVDPSLPYDKLDNLVVACRACNSSKRNRTPEVAGMPLRPVPNQNGPSSNQDRTTSSNQTKPNQTKEEKEQKSDGRSRRPIFTGQRLTVFDWQLDNFAQILGPYTDAFDLHEWFFALDAAMARANQVIPKRDGGVWLESQLLAECRRRGLPIAAPQALGKQTTRLGAALANIKAQGAL